MTILFWRFLADRLSRLCGRSCHSALDCYLDNQLLKFFVADVISLCHRFYVIITFNFFFKTCQPSRRLSEEFRLSFRCIQVITFFQHLKTEHKAVPCFPDPLFKCLSSKILDEFIRILVRFHPDHAGRHTGLPKDRSCPECRFSSGFITVIGQIDFIHIPFDQCCMSCCKCSSK